MSDNQKETFTNEYITKFQIAEPNYFDMIPAIIDHLTYIESEEDKKTGEIKWYRKRLTPHDKEVYRVLKQSAGKQNKCWKSADTLATQVGCGNKTIGNSKKSLSQSFEQLEGLSLIDVEEIRQATLCKETGKKLNTRKKHIITINHIWNYNNSWPEIKDRSFPAMIEEISAQEAELAIEKMRQVGIKDIVDKSGAQCQSTPSHDKHDVNQHDAPRGHDVNRHCKQIPSSSHPIVKKTNNSVEAAQIAFPSLCFSESFASEREATLWLKNLGIKKHSMNKLNISNNLQNLRRSAEYLLQTFIKRYEKGQPITNLAGYFLNTYNKGWYKS